MKKQPPPLSFAEVRVPIELDRKRTLIFNLNTMAAFEEASGKNYFDMLLTLWDAYQEVIQKIGEKAINEMREGRRPELQVSMVNVIRKIPQRDLRYLLWAALHEYDRDDNPSWPMTPMQLGRMLKPVDMPRILDLCLKGHLDNSPNKEELGEAPSVPDLKVVPPPEEKPEPMPVVSSGEQSIELDEAAFI